MSFGLMKHQIQILSPQTATDEAGFHTTHTRIKATVQAAVEHRHATATWVNRAAFTQATIRFRFRRHPNWSIDERDLILYQGTQWRIDSIETIASRYLEVLAHRNTPEGEAQHG